MTANAAEKLRAERARRDESASGVRRSPIAREPSIGPDPTFVDFGEIDFDDAPATERNPSPPDGCEGGPVSVTKLGGYTKPIADRVPVPVPVPVPVLPLSFSSPSPSPSPSPSLPPPLPALIVPAGPSALIAYEFEQSYDSSIDPVILPFTSPFAWVHRWSERAVELARALGCAIKRRLSPRH